MYNSMDLTSLLESHINDLKSEAALNRALSAELERATHKLNAATDALAQTRRELFGE